MSDDIDNDLAVRRDYVSELINELGPRVWLGMSGNGSMVIHIDTDVDCYGDWEPHRGDASEREVAYAQHWVEFLIRSTLNRLIDAGLLNVPGQD